jgi:hypothetical protein
VAHDLREPEASHGDGVALREALARLPLAATIEARAPVAARTVPGSAAQGHPPRSSTARGTALRDGAFGHVGTLGVGDLVPENFIARRGGGSRIGRPATWS